MMNDPVDQALVLSNDMALERARAGNLLAFTMLTYPQYSVNWHHRVTCRVLSAFAKKRIKRVMVFQPPRHGKSELTSRRLPALLHGMYPDAEILAASYNASLASDMTVDVQRIMDREEYHRIFPNSRITPEGSKSNYARSSSEHELIPIQLKDKYWVYPKGSYRSAGVGGSFTGRGADFIIIDDPVKNREDADSVAFREKLWGFYTSTLRTRLEGDASILLTMTRWHDDDLAGRLLKLMAADPLADQWFILNLPAIRDDDTEELDQRQIGEPLWPEKFSTTNLLSTKANLGSREWAALYQQTPMTEGGNVIKSTWLQRYLVLPEKFDEMIQSWDFAVKDDTSSAYAVGQVWGRLGSWKFLVDQVRGRWAFPESVRQVEMLSAKWPKAYKKLIEDKANGPAVIQTLQGKISGIIALEPRGDKLARLNAVSPEFESACVYIPHESIAPWISDWITEICNCPANKYWDQVDTTTQALDMLRSTGPVYAPTSGHGGG